MSDTVTINRDSKHVIRLGLKLGYKVDMLNVGKKLMDIVWIDKSMSKIVKILEFVLLKDLSKSLRVFLAKRKWMMPSTG